MYLGISKGPIIIVPKQQAVGCWKVQHICQAQLAILRTDTASALGEPETVISPTSNEYDPAAGSFYVYGPSFVEQYFAAPAQHVMLNKATNVILDREWECEEQCPVLGELVLKHYTQNGLRKASDRRHAGDIMKQEEDDWVIISMKRHI